MAHDLVQSVAVTGDEVTDAYTIYDNGQVAYVQFSTRAKRPLPAFTSPSGLGKSVGRLRIVFTRGFGAHDSDSRIDITTSAHVEMFMSPGRYTLDVWLLSQEVQGWTQPHRTWQQLVAGDKKQEEIRDRAANRQAESLHCALRHILNCHGVDNDANTPDFVLAELMVSVMQAYTRAVAERDRLGGRSGETPARRPGFRRFECSHGHTWVSGCRDGDTPSKEPCPLCEEETAGRPATASEYDRYALYVEGRRVRCAPGS